MCFFQNVKQNKVDVILNYVVLSNYNNSQI